MPTTQCFAIKNQAFDTHKNRSANAFGYKLHCISRKIRVLYHLTYCIIWRTKSILNQGNLNYVKITHCCMIAWVYEAGLPNLDWHHKGHDHDPRWTICHYHLSHCSPEFRIVYPFCFFQNLILSYLELVIIHKTSRRTIYVWPQVMFTLV